MTIAQIKSDLIAKIPKAVAIAEDEIAILIEDVLRTFYASYSPVLYERTFQLLNSCVKSGVSGGGGHAEARVYLDSGMMSYSTGASPSGASVMAAANAGLHGAMGLKMVGGGPALSSECESVVDAQIMNILLEAIQAAGIPIG